ncbi:MAG: flagellar hook-basal body protein [Candidatus Velthaea sp.]|jgi:flagellar basal-body rod protein FlgG
MNRAMYAAASGMAAQQTNLDIIADNLANADVAGFKGAAASFGDVNAGGTLGLGTAEIGRHPVFEQGKLMKSGGPFDLAIDGAGFFRVEKNGASAFTRAGEFTRAADGTLRNADGWALRGVHLPADALNASVERDGRVVVDTPAVKHRIVGRVDLAAFRAPEMLRSLGGTIFTQTPESGAPQQIVPGTGRSTIAFGMLEKSNVSIVESMMQILTAQRAYEANAKGVQAADEMLRIANNLHRS